MAWRSRRMRGRVVLVFWLGVLGLPGASIGAEPASRWISSDAVIYAESARPSVLIDRAADPRFLALANAVPGLREALARPDLARFKEVVVRVANELGKPWDEALRSLTGGGAILAVEAPRGRPPGVLLVVTPSDPALLEKVTAAVRDLARKEAEDRGGDDPIVTAEHRGIAGYSFKGSPAAYAIVEGRLVFADRADTLKGLIDRALDGLPDHRRIETVDSWRARRDAQTPDTMAWGLARLELLREIDPKRFGMEQTPDGGAMLLFGGWLETLRKAPWIGSSVRWTEKTLGAEIAMPALAGGRTGPFKGYIPAAGDGAAPRLNPPGVLLTASLWRDLAAIWEAKADVFRPEDAQNFNQLDSVAGTFFGGRDFGRDVLGALTTDWRLVVALQDPAGLNPKPDVILPAVALVARIKPGEDDFSQRLKVAFQSFVGLANLGAAQTKAPPLELLSETHEGVPLSTTRFMPPPKDTKEPGAPTSVHSRHNFSPTAAQVGPFFVLSSSAGLARDLVSALKAGGAAAAEKSEPGTFVVEAEGPALARLVEWNRDRLVMQNILDKGNDEDRAKSEVALLEALARYLGKGRFGIVDGTDLLKLNLDFQLGR